MMVTQLKHYIYISDTKVDMLYSQIPQGILDGIAIEFNINLSVLGAKLTEKTAQETRYSKLKVVAEYIEKHMGVGTVDEPRAYFKGILPMAWGPYGYLNDENPEIVYFTGKTKRTAVGLGGSQYHRIGFSGGEHMHSRSGTPELLLIMQRALKLPSSAEDAALLVDTESYALDAVLWTAQEFKSSPAQRLEFMAFTLLSGKPMSPSLFARFGFAPERVLLGTPLYVAYADDWV